MNIYEKMLDIMKNVQYLAKDDDVRFGQTKYKAMSEEKVTAIMREQMVSHGLVVFPVLQNCTKDGQITHVDVVYRIVNVEKPDDFIEVASCGDGWDSQDKGAGKAMTYAFKYMWLRTFAIPTGEDTDKICNEEIEAKIAEAKKSEQEQKEEMRFVCEDCGQQLKPYTFNGKKKPLRAHVTFTEERYGKRLCVECVNKIDPSVFGKGVVEWT